MSEKATVLVSEAKKVKEGQSQRGPWTLFSLVDGNEDRYSFFDHSLFKTAEELQGKRAEIEYEADDRGKTLKAIKEAPAAKDGDQPELGTGKYITGQKPPIEARRIFASTAAHAAAALAGQFVGRMPQQEWTPKLILAFYDSLEDHIFTQLLRRGKAMEDSDIPFLPEYEGPH